MKKGIVAVLGLTVFWSCGLFNRPGDPDTLIQETSDPPMSFNATFEQVAGNNICQSRLVDPVDDTELILISSLDGTGNYQVPLGKYGLSPDELLRIDCRTGEVIGVVKKQ